MVGDIADSICEIIGDTPMIAIDIAHPGCSIFMGANNRVAGEVGGKAAGEVAKKLWNCEIDAVVTHEAPGVGQVNIDRMNGLIAGSAVGVSGRGLRRLRDLVDGRDRSGHTAGFRSGRSRLSRRAATT